MLHPEESAEIPLCEVSGVKKKNKIRHTADEKVLHAISFGFVAVYVLICFYPFWNVFINSIATKEEAVRGIYFFPKNPTLKVYRDL